MLPESRRYSKKKLKFRNYAPHSNEIKKSLAATNEDEEKEETNIVKVLEEKVEEELDNAMDNNDTVNIAPKKANWDLKRDVAEKLAKLDRLTTISIVQVSVYLFMSHNSVSNYPYT